MSDGLRFRDMMGIAALALLLAVRGAFAQSMQTILTNGPSSNRFNVVFLSEGYTSGQLGQFLMDATNAANALLARAPYSEYRTYFNVFAISVASSQSGSDHPAYGSARNTYFNSSYDAQSDYLITIPPNAFDSNSSHGQGKLDALVQNFMPNCQLSVLLVNDLVQGGSDGFDKTAISYNGIGLADVLIHETGHVMANLGDEYTNSYPGFPDTEEPNTTRQTNPASIKWRAWIEPATPIPTPASFEYSTVAGLFQGAHYHSTGWYRPKFDCTMNHPSTPEFCEVCSEALVLSMYRKVRPIDNYSPGLKNVSVTNNQPLTFSLSLLQPATHSLAIQWSTNGVAIPGATNSSFMVIPQTLANGNHSLGLVVVDATALVRNDPTELLSQTNSWSLAVGVPSLWLDLGAFAGGGLFTFRVSGYAPQGFVIESSTNLSNWIPVSTNWLNGGEYWYTEPAPGREQRKYFRGVAR